MIVAKRVLYLNQDGTTNPVSMSCDRCKALRGRACRKPDGTERAVHKGRIYAARLFDVIMGFPRSDEGP